MKFIGNKFFLFSAGMGIIEAVNTILSTWVQDDGPLQPAANGISKQ